MTTLKLAALTQMEPKRWPPDNATIDAARDGERKALERVLAATHPKVAGYFAARGCRRDEASELAAEALVRVVEHIADLRDPGAYRAWLWKLARSVFRDWVRSKTKQSNIRSRSIANNQLGPDELFDLNEEEQDLRRAFIGLSTDDQEALWLRYVEELSYSSIAQIRGSDENAARVATHRARKRLEEALDQGG